MAHVEKSIEVQRPVDQVYAQWTQFEEFPEFMENVDEVRQLDDKHLEWKAKVAGIERRWKAEIVDQKPNKVIAWRSISGDQNDGKVEFQPIDGRTMVKLVVDYEPPAGIVGERNEKPAVANCPELATGLGSPRAALPQKMPPVSRSPR